MEKIWKFVNDWGHYGFIPYGAIYINRGDYTVGFLMLTIFFLQEASRHAQKKS
jgi:hypothetical protein